MRGRPLRIVMTRSPESYSAEAVPGMLEFTRATPSGLVEQLSARGFSRCALLGGSHIHSLFLAAGLVDEIWLTIEPLLFGAGTPLLSHPADIKLDLCSLEKLGASTLLAKYNVLR
jgi:riboflavin biosynthesis pyrimidine reductase